MDNEKILAAAIEIAKKQILEKLALEDPYLFAEGGIYHVVKQSPNGKKTFTLHIEDGFVRELVIHTSIRRTFKKKP